MSVLRFDCEIEVPEKMSIFFKGIHSLGAFIF